MKERRVECSPHDGLRLYIAGGYRSLCWLGQWYSEIRDISMMNVSIERVMQAMSDTHDSESNLVRSAFGASCVE